MKCKYNPLKKNTVVTASKINASIFNNMSDSMRINSEFFNNSNKNVPHSLYGTFETELILYNHISFNKVFPLQWKHVKSR